MDKFRCPWCGRPVAFKHECYPSFKVLLMANKPPDRGIPRVLVSRRCEHRDKSDNCGKCFWVEIINTSEEPLY